MSGFDAVEFAPEVPKAKSVAPLPIFKDPDDLYRSRHPYITFIYDRVKGLFFMDNGTHGTLRERYKVGRVIDGRDQVIENTDTIYGRYIKAEAWNGPGLWNGPGFVSIWNADEETVRELMPLCIKAMMDKLKLPAGTIIQTPIANKMTAKEFLDEYETKELSPEEKERLELANRMHLARGDEKKAIMKKLGVGGGKEHEWSQSLQNKGLLAPGHSIYNMHSEGFKRRLAAVLEDLA